MSDVEKDLQEPATDEQTASAPAKGKKKADNSNNIYTKLLAIMSVIGAYVKKDKSNTQQKYTYVSEGAILKKVQPALVSNRLVCCPKYSIVSQQETATKNGAIWQLCTVECKLTVICADTGTSIEAIALGQGTDNGDKAMAKAMTQAFKYAWWKLLCLETGDDPEADTNTDKQEFGKQVDGLMANNKAITDQPMHIVNLKSDNPMLELSKIWQINQWNPAELNDYVCKRFNRALQEISVVELRGLLTELFNYSRQHNVNVHDESVIPFY